MTKSTGAVLFQSCFFGLVGVIIAISLQDWRLCRYNRQYFGTGTWHTDCVRDSFFKYCYGDCTNRDDYGYHRCKDIPWNVWGKKTGPHQAWIILMFLCLGIHFISCVIGTLGSIIEKGKPLITAALLEIVAGALGIASMSVYTHYYDHYYCNYGKSYYFGWVGVIAVLCSSLMFGVYYVEQHVTQRASDRTALI